MIISQHAQNSEGWKLDRLGCPGSSEFKKIVTSKGARSKSRYEYMKKLATEIITGELTESFYNGAMEEGHEREQENIDLYQFQNSCKITKVGFCWKNEKKQFGSSPDALVDDDGLFEAKNAKESVQEKRLKSWKATEHFLQACGQMLVTGRKWCDVRSYCRGMKPVTVRFHRDEVFLRLLEADLIIFHKNLHQLIGRIQGQIT